MGRLNHVFASLIGEVVPKPLPFQGRSRASSYKMEVVNGIRAPVFWRNALGIVVQEASGISATSEEYLYINIEYEFDPGVRVDARELLAELQLPENHVERKRIYEALKRLESTPGWDGHRVFSYTLGISRETLEAAGGVAYLNDVDLVVGFSEYQDAIPHPYSPPGQRLRLSETITEEDGFLQRYLLVDNAGTYGPRWVNTGYGVFELIGQADPQLQDGVYVTTRTGRHGRVETTHYPLTDADEKLGLYRTRSEAEAFGKPETRFQAEIKQMEQELLREKTQMAKLKQEMEREKHDMELDRRRQEAALAALDAERQRHREDMERQRERLKAERDQLEFERQLYSDRMKFQYEIRTRERKDQSELLKAVIDVGKALLGIISVAMSIYAVVKKNHKPA